MPHRVLGFVAVLRRGETAVLGITAARLLLLAPLIWGIRHDAALAVVALAAIVGMDVLDGILARAAGLDGPARRILDAGVDRTLIHGSSIAIVVVEPSLLLLYAPLALRDLLMAAVDLWCIGRRRTHIGGRSVHRSASAAFALLGFVALTCGFTATLVAAILTWLVNYALLLDYLPALREVLASPPSPTLSVRSTGRDGSSQDRMPTSAVSC